MIILDENLPASQRAFLEKKRIRVRQVGVEVGRSGMKDNEIITLLHQLQRPTLFTLDSDFYDRDLTHDGYCLAFLDVEDDFAGQYIRSLLRHPEFNSKSKRMGRVIRLHADGITAWDRHRIQEIHIDF